MPTEMSEQERLALLKQLAQEEGSHRFQADEAQRQRLRLMRLDEALRAGLVIDEHAEYWRRFWLPLAFLALAVLLFFGVLVASWLGYRDTELFWLAGFLAAVGALSYAYEMGRRDARHGL